MKKEQVLELVAALDTAEELRDFAKETLGLNIPHNAGADTVRKRIIEHINAENSDDKPKDTAQEPETQGEANQEKEEEPKTKSVRRLKNTKNGRIFNYTQQLAKLKHMKEL